MDNRQSERLFVAVPLSPALEKSLSSAQAGLRRFSRSGKFVPLKNMHITLAFIGNSERRDDISAAMDEISFPSFDIRLAGLNNFDRLWYIAVSGDGLGELAGLTRSSLKKHGIRFDGKPFKAHITLARDVELISQPSFSPGPAAMRVESFSLMRSDLGGRVPIYTALHHRALVPEGGASV